MRRIAAARISALNRLANRALFRPITILIGGGRVAGACKLREDAHDRRRLTSVLRPRSTMKKLRCASGTSAGIAPRIHQGRDRLRCRRLVHRLHRARPRHCPRPGRRHGRTPRHAQRQWPRPSGRRAAERDVDPHAPLQARPHRHQARLRSLRVRQLHGDARRRRDLFLLDAHPQRSAGARSPPSKASKGRTASCTRCRRPWWRSSLRSAASVPPARSCLRLRS